MMPAPSTRFAARPAAWSVPDDLGAAESGPAFLSGRTSGAGTQSWAILDIDGDGRADLVSPGRGIAFPGAPAGWILQVYGHPDRPHWRVWRNTGEGFAADPVAWPVPDDLGPANVGLAHFDAPTSGAGTQSWITLDLDGDGRPDLVSPGQGVEFPAAPARWITQVYGHPANLHWRIWRNTGAGFAADSAAWPVPDDLGRPESGPAALDGRTSGAGTRHWATLDLDGDGRADLVSTGQGVDFPAAPADWITQVYGHPANPHWRIWRNTGAGFVADPAAWPVPGDLGAPEAGLASPEGRTSGAGTQNWSIFDLDGDGRADLVSAGQGVEFLPAPADWITRVYGHPANLHWRIWRNTGDGFAQAPVAWPVPDGLGRPESGPAGPEGRTDGAGTQNWNTLDLDGDGRADLVSAGQGVEFPAAPADWITQVYGHPANLHWRIWRGE